MTLCYSVKAKWPRPAGAQRAVPGSGDGRVSLCSSATTRYGSISQVRVMLGFGFPRPLARESRLCLFCFCFFFWSIVNFEPVDCFKFRPFRCLVQHTQKRKGKFRELTSSNPKIPSQSTFFPLFRIFSWLYIEPFPGCLVLFRGEEQRKLSPTFYFFNECSFLKGQKKILLPYTIRISQKKVYLTHKSWKSIISELKVNFLNWISLISWEAHHIVFIFLISPRTCESYTTHLHP